MPPQPGEPLQGTPLRGHHADAQPLDYLRNQGLPVNVGETFKPRKFKTPLDKMSRKSAGKRSYTVTSRKRGRYIYARSAHERYEDIALDATIRQAAPHQVRRTQDEDNGGRTAIAIHDTDLQRKVRVRKAANLILFAVDASWSMAAAERMEATKGAIMSLLVDAYQKRDRVCMVSFQKDRANLVLLPTSSVEMAKEALQDLPVGGKTPLSAGLLLSYQVIEREMRQNTELMPLMILLTDGAGNVSATGLPPREESLLVADLFRQKSIRTIVINTEHESLDRGLARELADALDGPCYTLTDLKAESLYRTVRKELNG
jgi:Mg-chelatase subunit ChlD